MSTKDRIIELLNIIPNHKMGYVLAYVQGLAADEADDIFLNMKETSSNKESVFHFEDFTFENK